MRYLLFLFLVTPLFASEHEAGIKTLMWPAFNFVILASLIIWKIRAPLRKIFTEKSLKVQELNRIAENKYQEAQAHLESAQKKLKNEPEESKKIISEAHLEAENLEKRMHEEMKERTERMWMDASQVMESEKEQKETELNNEILEIVVNETKRKVAEDKSKQKKASEKILSSLS